MLKANVGIWNRVSCAVLGCILLVLGWGGIMIGSWGVFLKIFGVAPLLTGLVGYYPIHGLLKFGVKKVG
jgi:hypothetical protein